MRFTLTYDGLLSAKGSPEHKMDIRRHFHRQLAELWRHEPLSNYPEYSRPGTPLHSRIEGHDFVALVHDYFRFRADLDILLLREAEPGGVLSKADMDNQLKTLFDALTLPQQKQQVPSGWKPEKGESPLYCLLEDDRHIVRLRMETERWLAPPAAGHVRLFVRVHVTKAVASYMSGILGI